MANPVFEDLEDRIRSFTREQLADSISGGDANAIWLVLAGALVFFMHAGFAMLEAGNIQKTSVSNIMFKNISTVSIGVLAYWTLGFGFAYGSVSTQATFIAAGSFFSPGDDEAFWFFQMVFAATAATIVSGAVAGRIALRAYFIIAVLLTGFVYPVVSHWIWSNDGFLSAFSPASFKFNFDGTNSPCGVIDFAGSGVVHMTGGVAAFWGALILGPRSGWTPQTADNFPPHNYALATLGTFILWFGWYGFNAGSTLAWDGTVAGNIAVTTTIAPGIACLVGMAIGRLRHGIWDLGMALNSILAGLVSITAPCATVTPAAALGIGAIGALVYYAASRINQFIFKVDDPVDAAAVHGACGLWGLIAVALFSSDELVATAYGTCDSSVGDLLVFQLIAAAIIFAWVSVFAILIFGILRRIGWLKLTEEEQMNVDATEHGGQAYEKMN